MYADRDETAISITADAGSSYKISMARIEGVDVLETEQTRIIEIDGVYTNKNLS